MDGSSSKETSCRRSCREGNRPQPLEVASLLKLAATNVLFPARLLPDLQRTAGWMPNRLLLPRMGAKCLKSGPVVDKSKLRGPSNNSRSCFSNPCENVCARIIGSRGVFRDHDFENVIVGKSAPKSPRRPHVAFRVVAITFNQGKTVFNSLVWFGLRVDRLNRRGIELVTLSHLNPLAEQLDGGSGTT